LGRLSNFSALWRRIEHGQITNILDVERRSSENMVKYLLFATTILCISCILPTLSYARASLGQKGKLPALRISENRRFLVTSDGAPFFYLGDTAWFLFGRSRAEEADLYLQDRASKGFTVIQAIILYGGGYGLNAYGHRAFIDKYPSKPNEAFFQHVDYVINKAESLGLYMGVSPIWTAHYIKENPQVISKSDAYTYGKFLGSRYKDKPIIWVLGGDWPGDGMEDVWESMAQGLAEGDGGVHLITYHPRGGQTSSTWFHDEEWLDFNMIQSGHSMENRNYDKIAADYELKPVKPVLDGEPGYENITNGLKEATPDVPRLNAFHVRRYAYCGVFAGAAGHTYGCNEVYQFWVPGLGKPRWGAELPWREAIDLPGASQMQYVRNLVESRPMLVRIPDQSIIAGDAMKTGERIQATRGSDGSYAFIYTAAGRPVNVHMDKISGQMVKAYWYNPRNGSAELIGEFPNTGTREFTPPSSGAERDWVLVLDDTTRDFPVPGSFEPKEE